MTQKDLEILRDVHDKLLNAKDNADSPAVVITLLLVDFLGASHSIQHGDGKFDSSDELVEKVDTIVANNGLVEAAKYIAKRYE